jgi:hypothetical protein
MAEKIRRNLMLREYDIKETPAGKQTTFSIKFIKQNGEIVFMPRAVACGLTANMSKNSLRGVVPIDLKGDKISHPTPVSIDAIIEWNGMEVIFLNTQPPPSPPRGRVRKKKINMRK